MSIYFISFLYHNRFLSYDMLHRIICFEPHIPSFMVCVFKLNLNLKKKIKLDCNLKPTYQQYGYWKIRMTFCKFNTSMAPKVGNFI